MHSITHNKGKDSIIPDNIDTSLDDDLSFVQGNCNGNQFDEPIARRSVPLLVLGLGEKEKGTSKTNEGVARAG